MSRFYKNEVNENIPVSPPQPNYDAMWIAIEQEASNRKSALQQTNSTRSRRKLIPAAIVFACSLVIAVPVFAGVALNWDSLTGGRSVTNALNNGIGQRYDLSVSNEGVTMSLNGVVTDGEKMNMIVSLDSEADPTLYDMIGFERTALTDESGTKETAIGYLNYDPASDKLLGIYESKDTLQHNKKKYTLEAENLVFYNNKDIPLKSNHPVGSVIPTGSMQYPNIHIQSVSQLKNQLAVRYTVSASLTDLGRGNPHLIVNSNGNQDIQGVPTFLPHDGSDLLIQQVFNLTEKEWQAAELHFSYLEETKRIAGMWNFDFKADGKKASEAIYSQKLQTSTEFQQTAGLTLNQLVITPLEMVVYIEEDHSIKRYKEEGAVSYNNVRLAVGDKEIPGGLNLKGDDPEKYQHVYQFQSPEWYKDWSQVPMKLVLKDAVVTKRDTSTNWVTLSKPVEKKQSAELKVDRFDIHFTYYADGKDLIVESGSDSSQFKGIGQTTIRVDGEDVYPEHVSSGPVSTGLKVERYKNVAMNETLELNPGFYSYSDPSLDMEVELD